MTNDAESSAVEPVENGSETQNPADDTQTENNPFKSDKKAPKRKKVKKNAEETYVANNEEENTNVMPTPPPSKRQKKREKRIQISTRDKDKEVEKTVLYLTKWDSSRDEWKYEKLRQIYVQKNIFDDSIISDEHSDVAIRYLSTSQGHARKVIVEAAETIMKEIEDSITEDNQEELTSSARYKRAREILQTMQD